MMSHDEPYYPDDDEDLELRFGEPPVDDPPPAEEAEEAQEIQVQPAPPAPAQQAPAPGDVGSWISRAIAQGASPEALGKMLDLYERVQAVEARKAFNAAMANLQSAIPVLVRNKLAEIATRDASKSYAYRYTTYDYAVTALRPYMDRFGLSHTYSQSTDGSSVRIEITVRHIGGHSEVYEYTAPVDTTARMNTTQRVTSANSVARRVAFLNAFGIATSNEDDDGRAAGDPSPLTPEQIENIEALLQHVAGDRVRERFLKLMNVAEIGRIPQSEYRRAVSAIEQRIEQQQKGAK